MVVQRDGALDKEQMGQMPPLLMPKREVTRFLERIGEHEKALSLRAAKQEAAAAQSELARSDKLINTH